MAGDWIKIEHALPNKPEVMAMADELGISEMEVVGHLVCFWTWVDQNLSEECPVVSGTKRGLDRVAGRTGFAQAMVNAGWLILENDLVQIPNYEVHLSQTAKSRSVEAKRKQKRRSEMSGSVRDKNRTNTGTEKRREEKSKEEDPPLPPKGEEGRKPMPLLTIDDLLFPASLDNPQGRSAFAEWLAYKKARREGYRMANYVNKLLAEFSRDGPEGLQAAVDFSTKQNYQGLVRPRGSTNAKPSAEQRGRSEFDKAIQAAKERERNTGNPPNSGGHLS